MKNIHQLISMLFLSVLLSGPLGCGREYLEDVQVLEELDGNTFYQSESDAIQAVTAAYTPLQARGLYKRELYALQYASGEYAITAGGFQYSAFPNFNFDGTSSQVITSTWRTCFQGIARANAVLERVPEIEFTDQDLQNRILGEAYFLRGLYYFHLVTLYGDAPILDRLVSGPEDELFAPSRNPASEVWAFIESDFTQARELLPQKGEYASSEVGRATSGAAQGYLGKAFLYQEKFAEASAAFKSIMDGNFGSYALGNFEDNFTDVNENNDESLFEVQFIGGIGNIWAGDDTGNETESTYLGTEFGPRWFGNAYPSDAMNAIFDRNPEESVRRFFTIAREGDSWGSWDPVAVSNFNARIPNAGGSTAIRKHNLGPAEVRLQSGINYRMMRYSDVLLMYAEAENEINGPTQAAYDAINQVRARAQVSDVPAGLSQSEFFEAIRTERRLEFMFELSAYFDLIRWGLGSEMPGFQTGKNELLPVPESDVIINPNLLPNNPGW